MDLLNVHYDDGLVLEAILSAGEAKKYISRVIKKLKVMGLSLFSPNVLDRRREEGEFMGMGFQGRYDDRI